MRSPSGRRLLVPLGRNTAHNDAKLVERGRWTDLSLYRHGVRNDSSCALMPKTCDLLSTMPSLTTNPTSHALLSRLEPGTEVRWHQGFTNAQLTLHLGLTVPPATSSTTGGGDDDNGRNAAVASGSGGAGGGEHRGTGAGIQVGEWVGGWAEGKVIVFDDSWIHKVWHRGPNGGGGVRL